MTTLKHHSDAPANSGKFIRRPKRPYALGFV